MGRFCLGSFFSGTEYIVELVFGPTVNAARGIAVQVQGAVNQFSINFQTAMNPQITKSYAAGDYTYMYSLIFRSSKFTFLMLAILSFPILLETELVLNLWLETVPSYTVVFVRLMLCITIIDAMAGAFMVSAQATGNIRVYQSVVGSILLFIVPVSYFVLKLGGDPWSVFVVHLCICILAFVVRLFIICFMIHLSLYDYFIQVLFRCFGVLCMAVPLPLFLLILFPNTLMYGIIICLVSILMMVFSSYFIGLTVIEREFVNGKILSFLKIRKNDKYSR